MAALRRATELAQALFGTKVELLHALGADCSVRHHAARRCCAGFWISQARSRRPLAAAILPAPTPSDSQNQMSRSRTRPKQLWPFCGQSSHELPLMATISCFLERILRVSKRKRTVYFSVSYRTAALAAESRLSDSQSSNPGSIPGSATRQSEVRRNLPAFPDNRRKIAAIPTSLALKPDRRKCPAQRCRQAFAPFLRRHTSIRVSTTPSGE